MKCDYCHTEMVEEMSSEAMYFTCECPGHVLVFPMLNGKGIEKQEVVPGLDKIKQNLLDLVKEFKEKQRDALKNKRR